MIRGCFWVNQTSQLCLKRMEGNSRLGVVASVVHHNCFIALIRNLGLLTLSSVHLPNPDLRIKDSFSLLIAPNIPPMLANGRQGGISEFSLYPGVTMLSKTISGKESISRQDSNNNAQTTEAQLREEK
jgi:hypothetical protein